MEDLTKQQIILLALLVSFVTSIATGIITFSLLSEAPLKVTQTINRVVERTVETVVPDSGNNGTNSNEQTVVRETVIVKEEDQVIGVVQKSLDSIVRIFNGTETSVSNFVSMGTIVSSDGYVFADAGRFLRGVTYQIQLSDGSVLPAEIISSSFTQDLVFLKFDPKDKKIKPAEFADSDVQLGQTVVAITGSERNKVNVSRVTDLEKNGDKLESIFTDWSGTDVAGALILNLSGEIVGVRLSQNLILSNSYKSIGVLKQSFPSNVQSSIKEENTASVGSAF